jgi:hypothetical protein
MKKIYDIDEIVQKGTKLNFDTLWDMLEEGIQQIFDYDFDSNNEKQKPLLYKDYSSMYKYLIF